MGDDQERRIGDCERRLDELYGRQVQAGERIAVIESRMEAVALMIRDSQKATNDRIQAMNADLKQNTESSHRRTVILVTVGLGAITAVIQLAGILLR